MTLSENDQLQLQQAVHVLENPGLAARLTSSLGSPIDRALATLPDAVSDQLTQITRNALSRALEAALLTLREKNPKAASDRTHKLLAGLSGAVGGAFGLPALAAELPVSTTIILRSIADIARSEGENLDDAETRLACLTVFALGGPAPQDDSLDTGYYAVRSMLASGITEAATHVAKHGMVKEGNSAMVRLISSIAARFSVPVSEKVAAQAVPALGAVGGASINLVFIDHFQDLARAHFTIRRLERSHGRDYIEQAYQQQRHLEVTTATAENLPAG